MIMTAVRPYLWLTNSPRQSCRPSAQNPLDTFPRSFSVDGELVANLLRTYYAETGEMGFDLKRASRVADHMILADYTIIKTSIRKEVVRKL